MVEINVTEAPVSTSTGADRTVGECRHHPAVVGKEFIQSAVVTELLGHAPGDVDNVAGAGHSHGNAGGLTRRVADPRAISETVALTGTRESTLVTSCWSPVRRSFFQISRAPGAPRSRTTVSPSRVTLARAPAGMPSAYRATWVGASGVASGARSITRSADGCAKTITLFSPAVGLEMRLAPNRMARAGPVGTPVSRASGTDHRPPSTASRSPVSARFPGHLLPVEALAPARTVRGWWSWSAARRRSAPTRSRDRRDVAGAECALRRRGANGRRVPISDRERSRSQATSAWACRPRGTTRTRRSWFQTPARGIVRSRTRPRRHQARTSGASLPAPPVGPRRPAQGPDTLRRRCVPIETLRVCRPREVGIVVVGGIIGEPQGLATCRLLDPDVEIASTRAGSTRTPATTHRPTATASPSHRSRASSARPGGSPAVAGAVESACRARWRQPTSRRQRPSPSTTSSVSSESGRARPHPDRDAHRRCHAAGAWDPFRNTAAEVAARRAGVDAGNALRSGSRESTAATTSEVVSPSNAVRPVSNS